MTHVRNNSSVTDGELSEVCCKGREFGKNQQNLVTIYSLFEIAGQLKIDFQKLILGKELIFMKMFENVFCYFGYSLNLVF